MMPLALGPPTLEQVEARRQLEQEGVINDALRNAEESFCDCPQCQLPNPGSAGGLPGAGSR